MNRTSITSDRNRCYFCNEFIDEKYLPEHMQHCGAVLEKCSENCGSYVPRRSLESHRRRCSKSTRSPINDLPTSSGYATIPKNESAWRDNVYAALHLLRSSAADCERDRKWLRQNLSINGDRLDSEEKSLEALRETTSQTMRDARQRTVAIETIMSNHEKSLSEIEERTCLSFNEMAYRLESVEQNLLDEIRSNGKKIVEHETEIRALKTFVGKESAVAADMWDSQTKRLNDFKLDLEIRCKISRELENKQDSMTEKMDVVVNEMRNQSEEIRKYRETTRKLRSQMKEVFKILEDLVERDFEPGRVENCGNFCAAATNGRLIWRIDGYRTKMTEAKEKDAVIYSPLFRTKDYGYALRMKLFLDGRRQWRGRHIIGCLRIVEGPWDPLLEWPCVVRATVILRDQDNPANNIRKIVKATSAGRGDENDSLEKDNGIDMFIPHTSLTRYGGFTKHDTIFLDIQVTELRESSSTCSLGVAQL